MVLLQLQVNPLPLHREGFPMIVLGSTPPSAAEGGRGEAKNLLPLQLPLPLWDKSREIIPFIF